MIKIATTALAQSLGRNDDPPREKLPEGFEQFRIKQPDGSHATSFLVTQPDGTSRRLVIKG